MESTDLEVLRKCLQWQSDGHRVTLATVVKTWGSSPRPVGSLLAVRDDGLLAGSVSGGCIEADLIEPGAEQILLSRLATLWWSHRIPRQCRSGGE